MTGSPTTYATSPLLLPLPCQSLTHTLQVIDFWEEYLQREELIKYPEAKIVLLQCTVSYLIMSTPDDQLEGIVFNLPRLRDATHIFMPVNDNPDPAKGGGSHWSLLLVSRIDGVAFHYDSMFPSNSDFAHRTSRKLELLLGKQLRFVDMNDAPQQSNGSDCGVYVCLNMRHLLLERLLRVDARSKIAMTMRTDDVNSTAGRKEMLRLVEEIRRKAERQRS